MDAQQCAESGLRIAIAQVPIFKQRRLGEATRDAVVTGSPQAVVDAVVRHAMLSTCGERELFEIVDIESEVRICPWIFNFQCRPWQQLHAGAPQRSCVTAACACNYFHWQSNA